MEGVQLSPPTMEEEGQTEPPGPAPAAPSPRRRRKFFDPHFVPRERRGALILACLLFWSIIAFFAINRYVIGSGEVVGGSMEPTLHNGERYLINKWRYRLWPPRRGDVVVIREPESDEWSVKRIVALPGETILLKDGDVFIDQRKLSEPYLPAGTITEAEAVRGGMYEVVPDCYFVVGDNRDVSFDSRFYGAIPRKDLIGYVGRKGL
jgi:signal peptidase I